MVLLMNATRHSIGYKARVQDTECLHLCKEGLKCAIDWDLNNGLRCFKAAARRSPSWHVPHDGQTAVYWLLGQYPKAAGHAVHALRRSGLAGPDSYLGSRLHMLAQMPLTDAQCITVLKLADTRKRLRRRGVSMPELPDSPNARNDETDAIFIADFLGRDSLRRGRYEEAITHFEKLISLRTETFDDWLLLATSYALKGKVAEGWAVAMRSLNLITFAVAFNRWQECFDMRVMNQIKRAIDQIATFNNQVSRLTFPIILVYFYSGQLDKTVEYAERAVPFYADGQSDHGWPQP